jgi:transcriptional regulator with XRE-family HTH domain
LGWSREALAYRSGLSWSAIEQIESGRRRNPRPDTLTALSRALGVTIDYLVNSGCTSTMLAHQVFVYRDDATFLDSTVPYLVDGIERSEAVLAVMSPNNTEIVREQLGKSADRIQFVATEPWYSTPVHAMNAYRTFMDDKVAQGSSWTRIVAEAAWAGRAEEEIRVWNHYESLVNMAFNTLPVTVRCLYDERSVDPAMVTTARLTHPQIVEGSEVVENPMYRDPGEFVLGARTQKE